jgi:outer membrane protein
LRSTAILSALSLTAALLASGASAQQLKTGMDAQQPDLSALGASEVVALALRNNRDIQQAGHEAERAEHQITEARSAAYPQLNGAWSIDRTFKSNVFVISMPDSAGDLRRTRLKIGTDYTSSLGAVLVQPLYVGGKVGTALEAARIYRTVSTESERLVRQRVILGALQTYYGALRAAEYERIARASLTQAEKLLADVEVRKSVGAATDYDLLRARVNAGNMRPRLIEAENGVRTSLLRLKEVMGVDPDAAVGVAGSFAPPDTAILAQADGATALRNRPEVASGRLAIALQEKAVRIARGDFLPTLAASTTLAYNGNFDQLGYDRSDWSTSWTAGLSLSVPIFTGFRNTARYRQARVDLEMARTAFGKTSDAVAIEVQQAAMALRKAVQQIASQALNVGEAERAVEIAGSLYANGKATQLEVLDAQLALEVARTNMAGALHEGTVAQITLKRSLGLLDAGE